VAGSEAWAAITVIAIGIAIYLYTAFWGFALIGGGTPAPIAPTKILVRQSSAPLSCATRCTSESRLSSLDKRGCFHSLHIAIYMVCMLLTAHLFVLVYEEPTLRQQFGEEYERYRASVPRWIRD